MDGFLKMAVQPRARKVAAWIVGAMYAGVRDHRDRVTGNLAGEGYDSKKMHHGHTASRLWTRRKDFAHVCKKTGMILSLNSKRRFLKVSIKNAT